MPHGFPLRRKQSGEVESRLSPSSWGRSPTGRRCATRVETLAALEIGCDARIVSAHRTPDRLAAFAKGAEAEGFEVIIAGAGGAAHLPGMTAAMTQLPVLGVPVESAALKGVDSLLSIVQMPGGVPVGTLAIGKAGAINAALLAAAILARADKALAARLADVSRRRRLTAWPTTPRDERVKMLAPGATIGILGGGQLARMLALAGARLGLQVACLLAGVRTIRPSTSARRVRKADFLDEDALAAFAESVDVVTYEFENVPARTAHVLEAHRPVRPNPKVLALTQDRLIEKQFVRGLGHCDRRLRRCRRMLARLARAVARLGRPSILKTRRFGYDGKGQTQLREGVDLAVAFARSAARPAFWKASCPSRRKCPSSRRADSMANFAPMTSARTSTNITFSRPPSAPAAISRRNRARRRSTWPDAIAEAADYVGVIAVEMFVVRDGDRANVSSSTKSRRACTIPVIGRSTAR